MAIYRLLYRRKGFIGLFLVVTTFWVVYMIISAPAAKDNRIPSDGYAVSYQDFDARRDQKLSITRKVVVTLPKPLQPQNAIKIETDQPSANKVEPNKEVDLKQETPNAIENNVIPPPLDQANLKEQDEKVEKLDKEKSIDKLEKLDKEKSMDKPDEKSKNENPVKSDESVPKVSNATNGAVNDTKAPVVKDMGDRMIEFGEKFKNKTYDVGEKVVNKTIEKLTDLGVIKKPEYVKLVYNQVNWFLNLSVEDIGNIMRDTEFLKKKQNITEMEYYPLMPEQSNSTKNVIFNITNSKYGLGFCDCRELSCLCCVRVVNKWMLLNSTTCSRITFASKSQELDFEFSVDMKPIYSKKISAEFPPKVCLASNMKVAGACILFSNVTSKVNIQNEDHKIHLSGCMEFDLTLYNKTVSAFPVGCFKIPGKESNSDEKGNNFINFVP